jgi:hypothetical protein
MTILQYAGFLGVTVLAILLVMRGCFFLFIQKVDPIKAIVPRFPRTRKEKEQEMSGAS